MTNEATPREVGSHAGLGPLPEPGLRGIYWWMDQMQQWRVVDCTAYSDTQMNLERQRCYELGRAAAETAMREQLRSLRACIEEAEHGPNVA